jgi:hypothetical protein
MAEGTLAMRQDPARSRRCGEELLALGRLASNPVWIFLGFIRLGYASLELGEVGRAEEELVEALALARTFGRPDATFPLAPSYAMARSLVLLGDAARLRGADDLARARYAEGLLVPGSWHAEWLQCNLGFLALHRGESAEAASHFYAALGAYGETGNVLGKLECLVGFAALAAARGEGECAARLLGAVDALLPTVGANLPAGFRFERERTLRVLQASLSKGDFAAAWAEGQALTLDQAVTDALEALETDADKLW